MFNFDKYQEIQSFLKKKGLSTEIVSISKNHSIDSVLEAIKHGVCTFGENRVQEAQEKFTVIRKENPSIKLHLTGPLQSNKVKAAISLFDVLIQFCLFFDTFSSSTGASLIPCSLSTGGSVFTHPQFIAYQYFSCSIMLA